MSCWKWPEPIGSFNYSKKGKGVGKGPNAKGKDKGGKKG